MKKDKEWLKSVIIKELMTNSGNPDMTTYEQGIVSVLKYYLKLINQLDEPEITEEQAWEVIGEAKGMSAAQASNTFTQGKASVFSPGMPEIPQWMADIIESEKYNRPMLALDKILTGSTVFNRKKPFYQISKQFDDYRKTSGFSVDVAIRNVMRAISSGYTIEPPKTLQVIVKKYDSTVFKTDIPEDEAMKLIEGWDK